MIDSPIAKSLGKVLIAAAWADGEIQNEEIECLKDLLFQLPEIGEQGWEELKHLLRKPITPKERRDFVNELKILLSTEEERAFALYALDRVIHADGVATKREKATVQSMKAAIWKVTTKTIEKIDGLMKIPIEKRAQVSTEKLKEVCAIDTVLEERVTDMKSGRFSTTIDDTEMRKLCLAGILMARIVGADGVIDNNEVAQTVRYLQEKWKLSTEEAHFVIMVSLSDKVEDLDLIRVCRHFYELTNEAERIQFLDVLFQVGMEDGQLTEDEIDEVINITANLKLEHDHFQSAFSRVLETA